MSTNNPKRKPRKPGNRKNTKVTGERSEAAFLNKAANLGFGVAKPWGDSRRYDFILDNGSRLHRVQVKCTESIRARAYETRATYTTGNTRAVYTKKDIDFIAAHVVPLDIWYIIPVEICTPAPMLRFYPHRQAKRMRLEPYREAWHHLQSPDDKKKDDKKKEKIEKKNKIEIQACADETVYGAISTNSVIPSAGAGPRSGSVPQSRACPERGEGDLGFPSAKPIRLPKTAAAWPVPLLRILVTRKGKQIFPDSPEQ